MARSISFQASVPYDAADRPILPFRIEHDGRTTPVLAGLVDSGADRSTFPKGFADHLGIDLTTCPEITLGGVNGSNKVRECEVTLTMQNRSFRAVVWFNPDGGPILLGRADVFQQFMFGFDQRKKSFLLQRY